MDAVNKLRGLVSNETLLAQLPFIPDAYEEMERVKAEQDALTGLYDFGGSADGTIQ